MPYIPCMIQLICRLGHHKYTSKQVSKRISNIKQNLKAKSDYARKTGGGPPRSPLKPVEMRMQRILGEGAVLDGIDGGVETENFHDEDSQEDVSVAVHIDPAVPNTSDVKDEQNYRYVQDSKWLCS